MLKIGEFARHASVSVKTLRFYERVGIFTPRHVDPRSGYRYYAVEQVEALRELRRLRALGSSIADLKAWLELPAELARLRLLLELRERLLRRLEGDAHRIEQLNRLIASVPEGRALLIAPRMRPLRVVAALTLRQRVRSLQPAVYNMFEAAERTVARHAARAGQAPFLLLHEGGYGDKNLDVEVCVPIQRAALESVAGRLVEGAAQAACLSFTGSYDKAPVALQSMRSWLDRLGARTEGPLRETYLRFGADQSGYQLPPRFIARTTAEFRTELQLPISLPH